MMKTIRWVAVVLLMFTVFVPSDVFCMGWLPPKPPVGGGVDPGPVSAPEPGVFTLAGMAVSAGVGYFLGKRKK